MHVYEGKEISLTTLVNVYEGKEISRNDESVFPKV